MTHPSTTSLAISMAQLNPIVGDVTGNADLVRQARKNAGAVDLVVCGELVLAGYPPEDLVLKGAFLDKIANAVSDLAAETADGGPALLVGAPWRVGDGIFNAALLLDCGAVQAVTVKHKLPNYGVFDEVRLFTPGPLPRPMLFRGHSLGVMICEDMWFEEPADSLKQAGADVLIVLNASPFDVDKPGNRRLLARERASETGLPLVYVNLFGGQDELVFDGTSFCLGPDGICRVRMPPWRAAQETVFLDTSGKTPDCAMGPQTEDESSLEATYRAMVLGLRDYVNKNYFPGVLIGMSGGIDSALSAAVAVDALGPDRVHCVMMPSPYTSNDSLEDAAQAATLMGAKLDTIGIKPAMAAFDDMLRETFVQHASDTTEENVQARSRGITLMALSNKFGYMVLSTGNKSEMSVGYATLYGDMCGGYSVLKDVYKTTVFALSRWRNEHCPDGLLGPKGPVMPERIITKPPSAELKPDQTDQDTLPPYDVLDGILDGLVECERSVDDLERDGYDRETVEKVWRMLDRAEYKRRQAPPGVKITSRAFGRDRRYPLTNGFTG